MGYLQRGGGPSAFDAILAARMSETCIELLMNDTDNRLLGYIDGHIRPISYQEAESLNFPINDKDYTLFIDLKQLILSNDPKGSFSFYHHYSLMKLYCIKVIGAV